MNELERLRKQYDEYSDLTDEEFVDKISRAKKNGQLIYPTLSKRLQTLLPKEGKRKFLIYGQEAMWTTIAWRLQEFEGQDVRIFCKKKEGKEHLKGMVQQFNSMTEALLWVGKDGYILCEDEEDMTPYRKLGYKCYGGNKFTARIEADRMFESEIAKKAGIAVANYYPIKTPQEGIEYIKKHPDAWCLKQYGNAPKEWNYVGKDDDGTDTILQLEWIMQHPLFQKHKEAKFMLQEKIEGLEFAVGAFWQYSDWLRDKDGNIFIEHNREHKKMLDNDAGVSCGEMGTVLALTGKESKLFKETLEKLTPILKKEASDVCLDIDANCGIVEENGESKAYLFELTPRSGYPCSALQEYLIKSVGDFYANLIDGKQGEFEYDEKWGVVTCLGASDYPHESIEDNHNDSFKNQPIRFDFKKDKWDKHIAPEYIRYDKEKEVYRIADDYAWIASVCSSNESIEEANKECLEIMEKVEVRAPVYRTDIGTKFSRKELPQLIRMGYL